MTVTIPAPATGLAAESVDEAVRHRPVAPHHPGSPWKLAALVLGAGVFLFPFYYMVIGSLQRKKNPYLSGVLPNPNNMTLNNYTQINRAISLGRTLLNSGIFTGGVLLCTLVFGVLAGYALARLHFRGRGTLFAAMLLLQVIPFQLITVPLYVLIVRNYGLADNYLGIIAPFAINSTAVFVFRQYFLQLPSELFEAARIDGASEMRILRSIAIPLVKPALMTATLMTFIGPWNEFLWPFLITKKHSMQPLAVALSNYITTVSSTAVNPFGAILAGACVLAAPAIVLFLAFQSRFASTDIGSGVKG
jgi:multiple sugar transport system permease protein